MKYILIVVFFMGGEAVIPDGWHPYAFETRQQCEVGKFFLDTVLEDNAKHPHASVCIPIETNK